MEQATISSTEILSDTTKKSSKELPLKVSIIVVNYNGQVHLRECLSSLNNQTNLTSEVILVDNNSTDGSYEIARSEMPEIRMILSPKNLGYSGAINLGLNHAKGDYIAILNMDVVVTHNWLNPLISFLDANPQAGAVSPKILLYNQPDKINAMGLDIHITGLPFNRLYRSLEEDGDQVPTKVPGIHGAAFLVTRGLLEKIGGMNEEYFMYQEDVEFSWILKIAGYDTYCVPESTIYHKYRLSMKPVKLYFLERNRWFLLLSTLGWQSILLLSPLLTLTELMIASYCCLRGKNFILAKARTVAWIWKNRGLIRKSRQRVDALRTRSDRQLLSALRLNYDWKMILSVASWRPPKDKHRSEY